ncbi:expressed unknown protein [Seminavis robusta]|uniref:Uncharacterized protein n=1 Tax=Seminavis robusta TaxID=568900 RepID=A0A9N8HU45_9STRA|nr:expressed unknown protein [Seminavis robusta]|eukprot:Sro1692_g291550.1 n/a (493) ;mRNA; r:16070-17548
MKIHQLVVSRLLTVLAIWKGSSSGNHAMAQQVTTTMEWLRGPFDGTSETCVPKTITSYPGTDPAAVAADNPDCAVLDWSHIQQMHAYTTFQDLQFGIDDDIEARIGPLFVKNSDERLDYECPPDQYNGFDYRYSFCVLEDNNTMLAVAYVTTEDTGDGNATAWLLGLDAIPSGKPFPETLEVNQPPFGAVRYEWGKFGQRLPMAETGALTICTTPDVEASCSGVDESQILDLIGLQYAGEGIFSLAGIGYTGPSVWIHDDARQLLYLTAGAANGFWFNDSGFFLADYTADPPTCTWLDNCNFACEVYNYDSRFFDFIGLWNITGKYGMEDFGDPQLVRVYLGNAIDAAGIFPCLMYVSIEEGYYIGLDKLDTTPGTLGSSFWYSTTVDGEPDYTEYPVPPDSGCPGTTEEWLGVGNNDAEATNSSNSEAGGGTGADGSDEQPTSSTEPPASSTEPGEAPTTSDANPAFFKRGIAGLGGVAILFIALLVPEHS